MVLTAPLIESARNTAYHDPRFKPVEKQEMRSITIEISILSPPKNCELKSIKQGDGVIMSKDYKQALFLPQVWEELSDKETFLQALAFKGRITDYATANYKKFSVIRFKEKEPCGEVFFEN